MREAHRAERGECLRHVQRSGSRRVPAALRTVRALALGPVGFALVAIGCTQNVRVEVRPEPGYGQAFTVVRPSEVDSRYWQGSRPRVFASGSAVNFSKGRSPRIAVVDEAGAPTYEEDLVRYPMQWHEVLLLPAFGLGYALWHPYPDPYVISPGLTADQRLRQAADDLAARLLPRITPDVKALGLFTFETDVVEKGRSQPYMSEGNRRLAEYLYNALRKTAPPALQVRFFKAGVDWYLKHTYGSLGEAAEARHELVARFARDERLDLVVYGKNYLYPQGYAKGAAINRCRFSVDLLAPKADKGLTKDVFEFSLTLGPRDTELSGLFLPTVSPARVSEVGRPALEVVCERAATQLARDLLEKLKDSPVLAAYPKPIHTYVSDFGYVAATPTNKRFVLPNRYGAYIAAKVGQGLMVGSAGTFALVDRKAILDGFEEVPDRGKSVLLGERSAWIDPETWPALGRKVGVKLVFQGHLEPIGADLNVTVWLQDLERGTKLAVVEHKIPMDRFRAREFELGNIPREAPRPGGDKR